MHTWQDWPKVESSVANYFRGRGCEVEEVKDKQEQYKDIDLKCRNNQKLQDFTVSVKYMVKARETGNLSFETRLISDNGQSIPSWFYTGQSDYTAIVVPTKEDKLRLLIWETKALKKLVPELKSRTVRLTSFQKSYNVGRKFNSSEMDLVRLTELEKYAVKDEIITEID